MNFERVDLTFDGPARNPDRPALYVFTTEGDLLRTYGVGGYRPAFPFDRKILLALHRGMCRTGGYSVEIRRVDRKGKQVVLSARLRDPPEEAFVTLVFTYPRDFIALSRRDLPSGRRLDFIAVDEKGRKVGQAGAFLC